MAPVADGALLFGGVGVFPMGDMWKARYLSVAELGTPCASDGDCASQHCFDGVCCDRSCVW
jgi:hypothetical protein